MGWRRCTATEGGGGRERQQLGVGGRSKGGRPLESRGRQGAATQGDGGRDIWRRGVVGPGQGVASKKRRRPVGEGGSSPDQAPRPFLASLAGTRCALQQDHGPVWRVRLRVAPNVRCNAPGVP